MQYTNHYNLNLPEGTDIVNPLVQDNPNYTAIDTALYNNKLRVIGSASEVKSGTVHAITRSDTDINVFRFVATSNFVTGDTFTVDGVSVTALLPDGTNPKNGAFVINASVLCILDGTRLSLVGLESEIEASEVGYDNSSSNLSATNVKSAIDELDYNHVHTFKTFSLTQTTSTVGTFTILSPPADCTYILTVIGNSKGGSHYVVRYSDYIFGLYSFASPHDPLSEEIVTLTFLYV